ncbi:MAG TPA: transposase [Terriglobia bacterium]|nr:transposase [Terriglobia bacterium]
MNSPLSEHDPEVVAAALRRHDATILAMATPEFTRKRNRLPRSCYVGQQWYFITACAGARQSPFSNRVLVRSILDLLQAQCSVCIFDVYAYCFMPDHLHVELAGLSASSDAIKLLHNFKGIATSKARALGVRGLWEKGFYDHILRSGDNHNAVAWYIFNNPVRKGFVKDPRDWPYSGSWMFDWKKAVAPPDPYVPPWRSGGFTPPSGFTVAR